MQTKCDGSGLCLRKVSQPSFHGEVNYSSVNCKFNCVPLQCLRCKKYIPEWLSNSHNGRCSLCARSYASSKKSNTFKKLKKIYLAVPFTKKDNAKSLGARWDPEKKLWYSLEDNENLEVLETLFSKTL